MIFHEKHELMHGKTIWSACTVLLIVSLYEIITLDNVNRPHHYCVLKLPSTYFCVIFLHQLSPLTAISVLNFITCLLPINAHLIQIFA
jgi:hypothetical protein